jgi:hypothetical protein
MGISFGLKVILTHLQTTRCRGILCSIFQENNVCYGLGNAVISDWVVLLNLQQWFIFSMHEP